MKRRAAVFIIIGIVAVVAALAYITSVFRPAREANAPSPAQKRPVVAGRPVRRDFRLSATWFGKVVSRESTEVVSLVQGRILSIEADDETPVKKGAPLFKIGGPRRGPRPRRPGGQGSGG